MKRDSSSLALAVTDSTADRMVAILAESKIDFDEQCCSVLGMLQTRDSLDYLRIQVSDERGPKISQCSGLCTPGTLTIASRIFDEYRAGAIC